MKPEPTYDLIKLVQAGDAQAFGRLLQRYRHRLLTLIGLRLGPQLAAREEVDDIYQETSLQAFRSIAQFQWISEGSFFRWLAEIAEHAIQNKVREHFKTKKKGGEAQGVGRASPELDGLPAPDDVSPLRRIMRQERFERLQKALQALSPEHREVVILARLEGHPMAEIARRLDRSVDAASMLLLRALRQLKRSFGTTGSLGLPDLPLEPAPEDPPGPQVSKASGPPLDGDPLSVWKARSTRNGTDWHRNGTTQLGLNIGS
jgi:RNA polymerase sigma-70 factor (ECF subfamily)